VSNEPRVVVLGATGMLGAMVADVLGRESGLELVATTRSDLAKYRRQAPWCTWRFLDAERATERELATVLADATWVVNAIGVIKPYITDSDPVAVERAIRVNSLFPHALARAAEAIDCRVIQIATDCVYSGKQGGYTETAAHDPLDVYGKTKSLGEVSSPKVRHLRCSIIGPEPHVHVSLLDWVLRQSRGAVLKGFVNHRWNGVTTLAFARMCASIIKAGRELPARLHVVPAAPVSKAELVGLIRDSFTRRDLTVTPVEAPTAIDRTLATSLPVENEMTWRMAGYPGIPSVRDLVAELAAYRPRFEDLAP
jgi:dTDP-4-dehydrorhamnose reductase